jgi:hypothetical protein
VKNRRRLPQRRRGAERANTLSFKKAAGRPQDLADIEAIEAMERPEEEK